MIDPALIEHKFNRHRQSHTIRVHDGKDPVKTANLVTSILYHRSDEAAGKDKAAPVTIDPAADTNCYVTIGNNIPVFSNGIPLFHLASARSSLVMVQALAEHLETNVGEISGQNYNRHSALTFLARTVVNEGRLPDTSFQNQNASRLGIFKFLIDDPRIPVNHRIDTLEGGREDGTLAILTRGLGDHDMTYVPAVAHLMRQRQTLVALHYNHKPVIDTAFAAANNMLANDPHMEKLGTEGKKKFFDDLNTALETQKYREIVPIYERVPDISGYPVLPFPNVDAQKLSRGIDQIAPEELREAQVKIGRNIWYNCAYMACMQRREELCNFMGRPEPTILDIAHKMDSFIPRLTG